MKNFIYLSLILFAAPLWGKDIYLAIGESHSFASRPLQKVIVQKKGLLSLYDHKNKITITGKKLGKTRLEIGEDIFEVFILHRKKYRTLQALKKWRAGKRGPFIEVKNKKVILNGKILLLNDFKSLKNFCHDFCDYENQTQYSPQLQKEVQSYLDELLSTNNLTAAKLKTSPYHTLRFPKSEKDQLSEYRSLLSPFGVQWFFDNNTFKQNSTIEIQVYIAHLKKSFLRQWGVEWPSRLSASVVPGQSPQIDSFQVAINALEASGNGQMLASPTLVTESGKEAQFHSGGEFPIQTRNTFNNSVDWKRYGLFLKTTPTSNSQNNMNIKIDLDISTLDHSQAVNGIPGLNRSHLNTQVTMVSPRPVLLSGFLQQGSEQARSGLPWLSQIPVFSPLFSTGQIHNTEYELVFILMPRLYDAQ